MAFCSAWIHESLSGYPLLNGNPRTAYSSSWKSTVYKLFSLVLLSRELLREFHPLQGALGVSVSKTIPIFSVLV